MKRVLIMTVLISVLLCGCGARQSGKGDEKTNEQAAVAASEETERSEEKEIGAEKLFGEARETYTPDVTAHKISFSSL